MREIKFRDKNIFIGIKDSNDIEIYEGDRVQFKQYLDNITCQGEVWYCEDWGMFLIKSCHPNTRDDLNFRFDQIKKETLEVIRKLT